MGFKIFTLEIRVTILESTEVREWSQKEKVGEESSQTHDLLVQINSHKPKVRVLGIFRECNFVVSTNTQSLEGNNAMC